MTTVSVVVGDLTRLEDVGVSVEAIVNAANSELRPGGGVCGAIFAAAGRSDLEAACSALGGCRVGGAVSTPSFQLRARGIRFIIHAVGPVWDPLDPEECDEQLAAAYRSALGEAERREVASVAFPALSTGIFGYPIDRADSIAARVVATTPTRLDRVVLVGFDASRGAGLRRALERAQSSD